MNQENVKVQLTLRENEDLLVFYFDDKMSEGIAVNLNSSESQIKLKDVFAKLLEKMEESQISLNLSIDEGYSKGLYKDVCKEYIEDLNREIEQVYERMPRKNELKLK